MKAARDQGDMNLDFNGQAGTGVNRGPNPYAGNRSGLTARENYGRGPTKGNASTFHTPMPVKGPSATMDKFREPPATASATTKPGKGGNDLGRVKKPANPDSINYCKY
jgi:hypothetical protein